MQWTCTGTSFSRSMAEQNCSKILVRRILEIHRNMDVGHAKTVDARRLVRQRLVMGVEPQVDNVADAESVDIGQLRFGRLAGCRYPIIETTPVIDRFRVGHGTLLLRSSSRRPRWGRSTVLPIWRRLIVGRHSHRSGPRTPHAPMLGLDAPCCLKRARI